MRENYLKYLIIDHNMSKSVNNTPEAEIVSGNEDTLNKLENTIADSVHTIVSPVETITFSIKGTSFSVDDYVKDVLVPLSENKS